MAVLSKLLRTFLLLCIGAYRTIGTTHLGGSCRFHPSCSEYALEALKTHPLLNAVRLIASRVTRCRPGGSFGDDPVPPLRRVSTSSLDKRSVVFKELS